MRIIFLNRFFHPDHSATSQMLSDLAFALARSGLAVTVVTGRQLYDDPARRLPACEAIAGVAVVRIAATRFGRRALAGRALDYATFCISAARALWRTARRGDVVVAKTDPPMLSVLVQPIAHLRGARAVNWLQDIFPEVAERLGLGARGPAGRAVLALLRRLRDRSLRAADANVVLGARMAEHLAGLGVAPGRIAAIPNWADGGAIAPVAPAANAWRAEAGLAPDPAREFVVGYSGNLGRAHDIDTLLEAIALVARRRATAGAAEPAGPRVTWLFVGGGNGLDVLRARLQAAGGAAGSASVRFAPYQPRARLGESLSAADVHLVSLRPELEGLIVPSKFYGIAAAGRPAIFIGDPDGEIARVITRAGCGLTVPQGDGAALARVVMQLAADPAACAAMGAAARRLFEAEYDLPIAVARWQTLLGEVGLRAQPERDVPPAAPAGSPALPFSSRKAR